MQPTNSLPSSPTSFAPTPFSWRVGILVGIVLFGTLAWLAQAGLGVRGQAVVGYICFVALAALFSQNLRAVAWKTVIWGVLLQLLLVLFIIKFEVFGVRPGYVFFSWIAQLVKHFLDFTNKGSAFVFGPLADYQAMDKAFPGRAFVFAFSALPTIIFVSSFFTVLYYLGILQFIVRLLAKGMVYCMGTSGAESLAAAANVFMGQTEAPLVVKPYVPKMTQSELLALMVGGMATISGGVMAVYIQMGADPIAILATSVMAAPCSLFLSKLVLPELEESETHGTVRANDEKLHRNLVDALSGGASDGLTLALNVAAMLIAFLAFLELVDTLLGYCIPGASLQLIFSWVFAPVAFLMGGASGDLAELADLLGTKLIANEFVAYTVLTDRYWAGLSQRTYVLATYALTGFANIASIGIQIGGIGGLAPERRADLAKLGTRALLAGFLATLANASLASLFLEPTIPLSSPTLLANTKLPAEMLREKEPQLPELAWETVPKETKSLVLLCVDADHLLDPTKAESKTKPFVHWVAFNLPASLRSLPAHSTVESVKELGGVVGTNDANQVGFTGITQRSTEQKSKPRRVFFKLYALDTVLETKHSAAELSKANSAEIRALMKGHVLAGGQLMGLVPAEE